MAFNLSGITAGALLAALLCTGAHLPPEPPKEENLISEEITHMEQKSYSAATADLALRLLQLTENDPTRMVSALSLSEALVLLAEGASGETLAELEAVIGLPIETLRSALPAYLRALPSSENAAFRSTNSLWAEKHGFALDQAYAKRLRTLYGAEILPVSFSDPGTADHINGWVSDATDGMIGRLVDENDVHGLTLLLLNALAFDAKWEKPFAETTVPGDFTCSDGKTAKVEYMTSKTDRLLIDCGGTLGFVKPYAGNAYSFVALLPPEDISLEDYLGELDGEKFTALVDSAAVCDNLRIRMPKFKSDYTVTLNEALKAMGAVRIFNGALSELDGIGRTAGNLCVDTVLQKTHIDVDTEGTRAAAVTAIMVKATSFMPPIEYREVNLDRPFLYAIIDNATMTPIFIGTFAEPQ